MKATAKIVCVMAKRKLRKIVVSDETYLWKTDHYHLEVYAHSPCVERVTIYLDGYKRSPLILRFRIEDNPLIQTDLSRDMWVLDSGCLIKKGCTINLNRPAVAAKLISHFIGKDWHPRKQSTGLNIKHALLSVETFDLPMGVES